MIDGIYDRVVEIGTRALQEDTPSYRVGNRMAEERIEKMREMRPKVHETRAPEW